MSWNDYLHSPDTAGVVGAVLGWLSAPGGTLREQLFNIGAGLGAAIFLAPYLAERAGIGSMAGRMAFAFIVGLVGMNLVPKLSQAMRSLDWAAILSKKGKS